MTESHRYWSGIPAPESTPETEAPRVELDLPRWQHSRDAFCARIAGNNSVLKILLKTKNDHYFIEPWIEHHANIVGLHNLIIFDNVSSSEKVRRTYARYRSEIPIVEFDGPHNAVHSSRECPELYECLKQACQFYIFVDTDEFLILIDGDTYLCDQRIPAFLQQQENTRVIPASWLQNVHGSDRRFRIGDSIGDFGGRLAWGKPLVGSGAARVGGRLIHNIQNDPSVYSNSVVPNLFVMHLAHLFPQQRIEANINKLIARGFASAGETLETIVAKDLEVIADESNRRIIQRWQDELRTLAGRSNDRRSARLEKGCIELTESGEILYPGAAEAAALKTFLTAGQHFMRAVLQADLRELHSQPLAVMREQWMRRAAAADYSQVVDAVRSIEDCVLYRLAAPRARSSGHSAPAADCVGDPAGVGDQDAR